MTGYILLCIALLLGMGNLITMKLYQKGTRKGIIPSILFALIVNFAGATVYWAYLGFGALDITIYSLILMIANATICITMCLLGFVALRFCNLSVYSLFSTLGGIIFPFIIMAIIQPEKNVISTTRLIGIILLPTFLILQFVFDRKEQKNSIESYTKVKTKREVLIEVVVCILILLLHGASSLSSSLQSNPINGYETVTSSQFIIVKQYIGVFICLVVLLIAYLKKKDKVSAKEDIKDTLKIRSILLAVINAIVASGGGILSLEANKTVPSVAHYPISSGGTIFLSMFVSALIFKEKQSKSTIIFVTLSALTTILFVF